MDFLYHQVTEKEKESILSEAKEMMKKFASKMSVVEDKIEPFLVERDLGEREEGLVDSDTSFSREIMFKNARNKNKDFIIAEKKKW